MSVVEFWLTRKIVRDHVVARPSDETLDILPAYWPAPNKKDGIFALKLSPLHDLHQFQHFLRCDILGDLPLFESCSVLVLALIVG